MNETYKYLFNIEVENGIRYIDAYLKTRGDSDNKDIVSNFDNELSGRLKIVDQSIAFFCDKLNIEPFSISKMYEEFDFNTESVRDHIQNTLAEKYSEVFDKEIKRPEAVGTRIPGVYRELYANLEEKFNERFFDGDDLKPGMINDTDAAFEYFSQYKYMSSIASLGRMKNIPKPAVNWLDGDIKSIDTEINEYNNRVDALNEAIRQAEENNTPLTSEQEKEQEDLEKCRQRIIDESDKIQAKFVEGDSYLQEVSESIDGYTSRIDTYKAICKELNQAQKKLVELYKQYNDPNTTVEEQQRLKGEIEQIFNDSRQKFNGATKMRSELKEQGDMLFSDVTLNVIRAQRQVAYEFASMYKGFDLSKIEEVNLDELQDEKLKKFVSRYRDLLATEREIEAFLKKRRVLRNPNKIFGQSFAEEDEFDMDRFNGYMSDFLNKKKKKKTPSKKDKTGLPSKKIDQSDPIDLQELKEIEKWNKKKPAPKDEFITLDKIIEKVLGTETIKRKQNKKYAASKIKIFQNPFPPEHSKRGALYRVGEAIGAVVGVLAIPINAIKKLHGKLQKPSVAKVFKDIETRAMELTDEEVEIFLRDYNNMNAMSRKNIPPIFADAMMARVSKYVQEKTSKTNQDLLKLILAIRTFTELGDKLDAQLNNPDLSDEERAKIQQEADQKFMLAGFAIDKFVKLRREGMTLVSGNGLEPLKATLAAHATGLNSVGGFASRGDYDGSIQGDLAANSDFENPNLSPRERAHKFVKHDQIFMDNTVMKRKAVNLFSNVSVGQLEYRPFIEAVDYDKDPLLGQLMTGIFMTISVINIINTIKNVLEHNAAVMVQAKANAANQARVNGLTSNYNSAVQGHNDMVSQLEAARAHGESQMNSLMEAQKNLSLQNIGAKQNAEELLNLSKHHWHGSGNSYFAADTAIHQGNTALTQGIQGEAARIMGDYSTQKISAMSAVTEMQRVADAAKSSLIGTMKSAEKMVAAQAGRGFDYTTWIASQTALTSGADLAAVSSDLMKTLLTLPHGEMMQLGEQMLLDTTNMAEQSAIQAALLSGGAMGAGVVAANRRKGDGLAFVDPSIKDAIRRLKNGEPVTPEELEEIEDFLGEGQDTKSEEEEKPMTR